MPVSWSARKTHRWERSTGESCPTFRTTAILLSPLFQVTIENFLNTKAAQPSARVLRTISVFFFLAGARMTDTFFQISCVRKARWASLISDRQLHYHTLWTRAVLIQENFDSEINFPCSDNSHELVRIDDKSMQYALKKVSFYYNNTVKYTSSEIAQDWVHSVPARGRPTDSPITAPHGGWWVVKYYV